MSEGAASSGLRPPLGIVVHDYAGHPFQVQLSRWLAGAGHRVLHLYSADVETPHGRLRRADDDPAGFAVEGVSTGRPLAKYDLWRRWLQERAYGDRLIRRIADFRPDIVLSANPPPTIQARLLAALRRRGVPLLYWVQDIYAIGAARLLKRWPPPVRWLLTRLLGRLEFGTLRACGGIVVISEDFLAILADKGVRHPVSAVIENWAPLDELPPRPKDNAWSRQHGLADKLVFLCAGTLGLKHNPGHLVNLALAFQDDPEVRVVVVSQGPGRTFLEAAKGTQGLDNLVLLDYQPFERMPEVLASADVAVLLLETFAGALSVPSKVYSYFCAGRPILGALPPANLACRMVEREQAGLCVASEDEAGFVAAARRLRADPALRAALGARQRAHAEHAFDIDRIGERFLEVIDRVRGAGRASP